MITIEADSGWTSDSRVFDFNDYSIYDGIINTVMVSRSKSRYKGMYTYTIYLGIEISGIGIILLGKYRNKESYIHTSKWADNILIPVIEKWLNETPLSIKIIKHLFK